MALTVASNLTDLGRLSFEQDALKKKADLEMMSRLYDLASRKADLDARKQEADKDRALKYFEVGSTRSLKERELDNENKRLTAEANRWAEQLKATQSEGAATRASTEKIAGMQLNPALLSPKSAGDIAATNAEIDRTNAIAESAASEANRMLSIYEQERKRRGGEWFTSQGTADAEYNKKLGDIRNQVGEGGKYIDYDMGTQQYRARKLKPVGFGPGPSSSTAPVPAAVAPVAGGLPAAPAAAESPIPWTLLGPNKSVQQFPTREELDAAMRAMQMKDAMGGGYLRFDPATGSFQ